jgi:hypothetical protein
VCHFQLELQHEFSPNMVNIYFEDSPVTYPGSKHNPKTSQCLIISPNYSAD